MAVINLCHTLTSEVISVMQFLISSICQMLRIENFELKILISLFLCLFTSGAVS